ncbi:putative gustatory receptor 28b isoform X4 [Bradysia coprophila]|uniref:putative gustatory receptor 28b isoform X4 n=1 Tax=Bradysia coprophila TaxID=38358 RepID=UPI00187D75A4|nr:putative gustatory receptor 28b isoform X4 [Bradysia coprophila]
MWVTYRFEGLFPFQFNNDEAHLKTSKIGMSFTLIQLSLYFTSFFHTIFNDQSFVVYFFQTEISTFGGYLQFAVSCASMVTLYTISIVRRHKIRLVFENLYEVDKRFAELHQGINHKTVFRLILIGCTMLYSVNLIFVLLSLMLLSTRNEYPNFLVWWSFFFPYLILTLVVVKFITVVGQLLQRFRAVTGILRNLCGSESTKSFNVTISPLKSFKQSQDSSSNLLAERKLVEVVKDVCGIHDDLSDTCLLAEEYFALKMLTIVGIGFLIIVFNLYYVMEIAFGQIPDEFQEESYKFLIFLVFQVAMNILGILCIIQSSCAISNENRNCSIYVHKLMNTTTDDIAKEKLLQFSLQLIHRKVKFTALNLFPLDRTLIFTIAGAATTYLIILFQFSNQNRFPNVKT